MLLSAIGKRGAARRAGRRAGIAAYLSKPLRLDRLEVCLTGLLDTTSAARPSAHRRSDVAGSRSLPLAGHVLVAEDDPLSQKVTTRLLETRGYRVDVVGNGRSAVEACLRRAYDLVFMDCRLPELDGFAATEEIRRREPPARRTPIVALTASTAPALHQRCLDAGMSGHLTKPLRTNALDDVLRHWTARRSEPAGTGAVEVLDAAGLLERVDGDLTFVRELAVGLQQDRPRWLTELRSAITADDAARVEQVAHAICGSASNLGGASVTALARHIETHARGGDVRTCAASLVALERELERFEHALLTLDRRHLAAS